MTNTAARRNNETLNFMKLNDLSQQQKLHLTTMLAINFRSIKMIVQSVSHKLPKIQAIKRVSKKVLATMGR